MTLSQPMENEVFTLLLFSLQFNHEKVNSFEKFIVGCLSQFDLLLLGLLLWTLHRTKYFSWPYRLMTSSNKLPKGK